MSKRKLACRILLYSLTATVFLFGDTKYVQAEEVRVEHVNVSIPEVEGKFTIGWISDMHVINDYAGHSSVIRNLDNLILRAEGFRSEGNITEYTRNQWLKNVNYLCSLNPNVVVLGGDIIDYYSDYNEELLKTGLSKFNCPVIYLRADHDYEPSYIDSDIATVKIKQDELYTDKPEDNVIRMNGVSIVGITNSTTQISEEQFDIIKKEAGRNKVILVTHVPYASKIDSTLKDLCIRKKGKEYYWGSSIWSPTGYTQTLMDTIYTGDKIPLVLSGHIHANWDGFIAPNVRQHIFTPSYSAVVGLVTISGQVNLGPTVPEPNDPEPPIIEPKPQEPILDIIIEPSIDDKNKYTFKTEGKLDDPDKRKKKQIIRR